MYELNKEFELEFEIKKIIYRSDSDGISTICNVKLKKHNYDGKGAKTIPEMCILKGEFPVIYVGDIFKANVKWVKDFTYGYQLAISSNLNVVLPEAEKEMANFIKKRVKGLGLPRATKIVQKLGLDCISKILDDKNILFDIEGLKEKIINKIYDTLSFEHNFENVSIFINSMGLRQNIAIRIYEEFKENSIIKIKENPYMIGLDYPESDMIAYKIGYDSLSLERIKCGIYYYINKSMVDKGNIYIIKDKMIEELEEFLSNYGSFPTVGISEEVIENAIVSLRKNYKIVIEKNKDGQECIYRKDYNNIENGIVDLLYKLIHEDVEPLCLKEDIDEFLVNYEKEFIKLANKQRNAVFMGLLNRISIITGGPGTGKTQTINTLIKCIKSIKPNVKIKLSAPTGKASKRVTELTGEEASTIHRMINIKGFSYNEKIEEIDADIVIVDESSMIDAYLFLNLLKSIGEDTRLILVGDYNQLPSVSPGLILRDLITSGKIPVTILDEIFRQAQDSQIVMNSYKIIHGEKDLSYNKEKADFYFVKRNDPLSIKSAILQCVNNLMKNKGYSLNEIAILSPMSKGIIGTVELNRAIQMKHNHPTDKPDLELDDNKFIRCNDIVMQTTNNYDKDVFNGEVGSVLNILIGRSGITVEVDYGDRIVSYNEEEFKDEVILAYSMTIHKSQGSEFPVVIIPIHETQKSMLNRNLIYTAVTRAKSIVVFVGSKDALEQGIIKQDNIERQSAVKEKIIARL